MIVRELYLEMIMVRGLLEEEPSILLREVEAISAIRLLLMM
jgi:hypothetical protein